MQGSAKRGSTNYWKSALVWLSLLCCLRMHYAAKETLLLTCNCLVYFLNNKWCLQRFLKYIWPSPQRHQVSLQSLPQERASNCWGEQRLGHLKDTPIWPIFPGGLHPLDPQMQFNAAPSWWRQLHPLGNCIPQASHVQHVITIWVYHLGYQITLVTRSQT